MKHLFKILLALIFFSLINLGYAEPPRTYIASVTVNNRGSAPLYYQNWQPVHPGVTVSGAPASGTSITPGSPLIFSLTGQPGQLPQIMLTLGYDQTDLNNSCTIRIQPLFSGIPKLTTQGKVVCQAKSSVAGQRTNQRTNVTVNMMPPEKKITPKIFNFTVKNDSSFPLTYHSTTASSLSLHKIPANSSVSLTHTLDTPDSAFSISYGFTNQNFCTFSYQSSQGGTATASPTGLVTCRVGSSNTMHVNKASNYYLGAKCGISGGDAWVAGRTVGRGVACQQNEKGLCRTFKATCARGKLTCKIHIYWSDQCAGSLFIGSPVVHESSGNYSTAISPYCFTNTWVYRDPSPREITNLCAWAVQNDSYLNQHYGN